MDQKWICALVMRRRRSCLLAIRLCHQPPLANVHLSALKTSCILTVTSRTRLTLTLTYMQYYAKLHQKTYFNNYLIWSAHSISNTIKFRLYSSIVLSTAPHACETRKSTARISNTVASSVLNEEITKRAGMHA